MLSDLSIFFGQVRWVFLQREWCFVVGSILRCSNPVTIRAKTRIVLLPLRVKWRGFVILIDFFLSTLCHLAYCDTLFLANLIPWDACWIAVLGWSISSRCSWINGLLITDVMPIWDYTMNDHSHKYCNLVNCPTVICLPCHLLVFERDATSEPMAPWSILHYWILLHNCYLLFAIVTLLSSISITCV